MINRKSILTFLSISLLLLVALVSPVSAIGGNAQSGSGTNGNSNGQAEQSTQSNQSENAQSGKLNSEKLKTCQGKEAKIKSMFTNMNRLGEGQLNLFDNIARKVQNFYEQNKYQISNYDELVAQIEQTRTRAQEAIQASLQISNQFGCSSDDPIGTTTQFKAQVKTQVQELKDYRESIKNLVSAIKVAVESTEVTEQI